MIVRFLFFAVLVGNILVSCAEKADLDPRERYVQVHAILENKDVQTVNLNYTSYVSENSYLPVEEAEVIIEKVDETGMNCQYEFTKVNDGIWQANFRPAAREKFNLTVKINGEKEIKASTVFPDSLKRIPYHSEEDPAFRGYVNMENRNDTAVIWIHAMDYVPEQKIYEQSECIYMYYIDDKSKHYLQVFPNTDGRYMRSEGRLAYGRDRVVHYMVNYWIEALFEIYGCYKDVDNDDPAGWMLHFKGRRYSSTTPGISVKHPKSYITVQSVNKDYDRYLLDTYAFEIGYNMKDKSDLTHLWDYEEVYSNVQNGVGIFAAAYRDTVTLMDAIPMDAPAPIWDLLGINLQE